MYFYKRIFCVIVSIAALTFLSTLIIYFNGLSNFEYSIGGPTSLEIKFMPPFIASSTLSKRNSLYGEKLDLNGKSETISDVLPLPIILSKSSRKDEIQSRVERVKSLCKKFHLGSSSWPNGTNDLGLKDPPTPLHAYFFFNREYKLAWCPVYKAGSTTWLHHMMMLKGFSEDNIKDPPIQLSIWARQIYQDAEPGKEFDSAVKLLIVRHPFERVISAYRDKLSNSSVGLEHGTRHYYEKYGRKIVEKFRTDKTISQVEPTFEEFVRYLIKTNLVYYADDHWLPASLSCTPCRVDYDYIAKLESYTDDQKFIIESMNLTGIIQPRWQHRTNDNLNHEHHNKGDHYPHLTSHHYFSQLTKTQIHSLYKQYYLDFELFGYSYKEYLKYGKETLPENMSMHNDK